MSTRQQKTTEDRYQYLQAARRYCKAQYNKLRSEPYRPHCSHDAAKVMLATEERFTDLGTFGVEGWCDDDGNDGVQYLNTGQAYDLTIVFKSETEQFRIASWGDIAEKKR